jgi:ribonucleoside-diphosphate reductase alpha chain
MHAGDYMSVQKIRKRDGSIVDFDREKIVNAIFKSAQSVGGEDKKEAEKVADKAIEYINEKFKDDEIPTVEQIQDIVEKALIESGHAATAKSYILYRHRKSVEREAKRVLGVKDDLKLPLNAIQVLERRYLLKNDEGKIIESPSHLFRRVADYIATNEKSYGADEKTERYYADAFFEIMTNFEFLPNSPTLMNAGTGLGQLAACFVLPVEDDIGKIFDAVKNAAIIHKTGGGTGFCFSYLRPKGDFVKSTAGVASGPISFMSAFDNATNVIKQGGKRRGANMGVMHVWHPDVEEFISAKQTSGVLENFNVSVAADDEFMKAVEKDEDFALKNPRDGKPLRNVNARSLFKLIAYSAWKSAEPGLLFIDAMNNTNPTPQFPIKATNPCVSGDTLVTTNEGLIEIPKVHNPHWIIGEDGQYHPVKWAGETGEKEVFLVKTNAGYETKATANHKFMTSKGWKPVSELSTSDVLVIQKEGSFGSTHTDKEMALMLGWLIGDGTMTKDVQDVIFYFGNEEKKELLPIFKSYLDKLNEKEVKPIEDKTETRLKYSSKIAKMFFDLGIKPVSSDKKEVPKSIFLADEESVKHFLSALFGADGSVQGSKEKGISIRLASNSSKLLKQVQVLLLQFGIVSKLYEERRGEHKKILPDSNREPKEYICKPQHELIISKESMFLFMKKIGFAVSSKNKKFEELKPKQVYSDSPDLFVKSVESVGLEKVYDLTEPMTHSFSANGLIVHNCGEVPMPDFESCNLGSINLVKFVDFDWSKTSWKKKIDWKRLRYVVRTASQFLDNVIDLNNYPIPEIKKQTQHSRRIGLGIMGFAKMLTKIGVRYGSDDSFKIAEEVMKFITEEGRKMSHELGRARGSFPGFKESVWKDKYDAMRNATMTSIAPTGTISMIADSSSGIEPLFALSYIKTVMDGTKLYYSDAVFEHVLKVRGLYSPELMERVIDNGSIQTMEEIPKDVAHVFVISHDITVEGHVKMQAAFQKHTDLAVSKTINMPAEATVEDVENAYMQAWREGCKGITIYRDGSRGEGVLSMTKKKKEEPKEEEVEG